MKIVIFGGAFDPVHSEHIKLIRACKEELKADKVLVVPSFCPPHKSSLVATWEDRVALLNIALGNLDYVEISEIEKEFDYNPSYLTIKKIKARYGGEQYLFLIGGDSIEYFDRWEKPAKIAEQVQIVVAGRKGYDNLDKEIKRQESKYGINIIKLDITGEDTSSTIIRARIILGEPVDNENDKIIEYIKKHNVYSMYDSIIDKLYRTLPKNTFEHSKRTALYGVMLAAKQKMNFEKVFLSCLLHDCAKNTAKTIDGVPKAVVHQFVGAETAEKEYNIKDDEILSAIKYHTTGRPNMTKLEKLVFMADMLESGRTFEGVSALRTAAENDFEKGFVECVKALKNYLDKNNGEICLLTNQCYTYYTK